MHLRATLYEMARDTHIHHFDIDFKNRTIEKTTLLKIGFSDEPQKLLSTSKHTFTDISYFIVIGSRFAFEKDERPEQCHTFDEAINKIWLCSYAEQRKDIEWKLAEWELLCQ